MILLLTHSGDYFTIDRVQAALERKKTPSLRFDTDLFPSKIKISQSISNNAQKIEVQYGDKVFSNEMIQAVWVRRIWTPKIDEELDPIFYKGCVRESQATLSIFLNNLAHLPWIDPIDVNQKAENKFLQYQEARKAQLTLPKTLVTNHPDELKNFYHACDAKIVAKMMTTLSYGMQADGMFVYTSKVEAEHLEDADMLKYCPMTFQEMIPKAYELRIIYVDGHFFTGKIDATKTEKGQVDWRQSEANTVAWEKYEIPSFLKDKLHQFMQQMNLVYGAIDVIKKPDGAFVFLEVNPSGEWGMIEKELDEPISEAIAQALIDRIQ